MASRRPTGFFARGCTSVGCPRSEDTAMEHPSMLSASLLWLSLNSGQVGLSMLESWTARNGISGLPHQSLQLLTRVLNIVSWAGMFSALDSP